MAIFAEVTENETTHSLWQLAHVCCRVINWQMAPMCYLKFVGICYTSCYYYYYYYYYYY